MATSKQQAQDKGYRWNGAYSFDKATIVEQASQLRAQGHRALVVYEPANRLSVRRRGGWAIYLKENK